MLTFFPVAVALNHSQICGRSHGDGLQRSGAVLHKDPLCLYQHVITMEGSGLRNFSRFPAGAATFVSNLLGSLFTCPPAASAALISHLGSSVTLRNDDQLVNNSHAATFSLQLIGQRSNAR